MDERTVRTIVLIWLAAFSLLGFFSMFSDKRRAKNRERRISEKALFLIALLGGSFGSLIGMWLFRHKTKHWYFVVFMPLILVAQAVGLMYLFR